MYSPDERQNIRSAQNDAAMPSNEEVESSHRRHLRNEGCSNCDEHDPDELNIYRLEMPSCSAAQVPRDPSIIFCDECADGRATLRERAIQKARDRNKGDFRNEKVVGLAFYECDNWAYATIDLDPDPVQPRPPRARIPVTCRCDSALDEYVELTDTEGDN